MAKGNYSIRYDPDKLREMIENGENRQHAVGTAHI